MTTPFQLEHHIFEPTCTRSGPDVVMLHGICTGAWVFPEHFIAPFLESGFRVHTLSYRGHGESAGHSEIQRFRLSDYVDDVQSILKTLDHAPLILGHSLGTAIAQILIRDAYPLAGVCLMSPVPPYGLAQVSFRMLWSDPMAYQQLAIALTVGVKRVSKRTGARLLFSTKAVSPLIEQFFNRCDDESPWLAMDLQGFPRIGPVRYDPERDPPMMVVSGAEDQLIRLQDAQATADFYDSSLQVIAGGSHMLMFDTDAPKTAYLICQGFAEMGVTV